MTIYIDVVDGGCSLRRRNIAIRAERIMLQVRPPSEWEVRDFRSVEEWRVANAETEVADAHIVFLHASSGQAEWTSLVQEFGARVETKLGDNGLLISFTGGSLDKPEAGNYTPGNARWWRHYTRVSAVRDFPNPAQGLHVGTTEPPVEGPIRSLLSDAPGSEEKLSPPLTSATADVRHAVVNAVSPLREKAELALTTNRELKDFLPLWTHAKERLRAHLAELPDWVRGVLDSIDASVPEAIVHRETRAASLQRLVSDLTAIEGYARGIGHPQMDWDEISQILATSWDDVRPKILWIDDEPAWLMALKDIFEGCGIEVVFSSSPDPWLENPDAIGAFDAVVLDIILEGHGASVARALDRANIATAEPIEDSNAGIGLLQLFASIPLSPPVFMLSARESATVIRACAQFGARDYLVKGRTDYARFLTTLRREIEARRDRLSSAVLPANSRIVVTGPTDPFNAILIRIDQISKSGTRGPVLLAGQPGVGKEEIAREIHLRSPRREHPFVIADCSAINPSLIEDDLFGHVKGAFTNAIADRAGRFEEANGGTLLIDEIDKIDVPLQNKLLRAVETGTFRRLGGDRDITVNLILVMTSNLDPRRATADGKLSPQLFSRQRFILNLPSLRERAGAVPEIAMGLCQRLCGDLGWSCRTISQSAMEWLKTQAACGRFDEEVGNVRGLRNLLEAALVFHPRETTLDRVHLQEAADLAKASATTTQGIEAFREAAAAVARYIVTQHQASLKSIEDMFRAELFKALRARMTREDMRTLFDMTAEALRQHFKVLRDKGLLPPDV